MNYSIKEISEMFQIPISTIRYYDKEGLFPFMKRKESGYRIFTEDEISSLRVIECFKATGMSIKEIKHYFQLAALGDSTLQKRYELILKQKKILQEQMNELQKQMDVIHYKEDYYQNALKAGTESIHKKN